MAFSRIVKTVNYIQEVSYFLYVIRALFNVEIFSNKRSKSKSSKYIYNLAIAFISTQKTFKIRLLCEDLMGPGHFATACNTSNLGPRANFFLAYFDKMIVALKNYFSSSAFRSAALKTSLFPRSRPLAEAVPWRVEK